MLIEITDPADSQLVDYTSLTDVALRRKLETERGLFMAESNNVITRALRAGYRPRSFLLAPKWLDSLAPLLRDFCGAEDGGDIPVFTASEDLLRTITGFHLHRGALAAMNRQELPPVSEVLAGARRVAILEDLVDHTNVGAVFRSAAALGIDAVLVTPSCADPLYRRAVRVSMGTVFQVPWTRLPAWPQCAEIHEAGFTVAALALSDDSVPLDEFASSELCGPEQKVALLLGTEGDGLSRRAVAGSDVVVRIPMGHGVDSLNVAAASAVAFWAVRRPSQPR